MKQKIINSICDTCKEICKATHGRKKCSLYKPVCKCGTINNWTIELGEHGWIFNPEDNNWEHIVITSNNGIFVNGELLAKGRLKVNEKHKLLQNKPTTPKERNV